MSQCLETPVLIMMPRGVKKKEETEKQEMEIEPMSVSPRRQKEGISLDFLKCFPGHRCRKEIIRYNLPAALRRVIKPGSVQSGEIYMRGVAAHVRPRSGWPDGWI